MNQLLWCGLFILALSSLSCSHYVGLADEPVALDGRIDTMRNVILQIRATIIGDMYGVTMKARQGSNGPVINSIRGGLLYVNGNKWDLSSGFPYESEVYYVPPRRQPEISIGYVSPEKFATGIKLLLDPIVVSNNSVAISRTSGFAATIRPAIRENESIEIVLFRSSGGISLPILNRAFKSVGTTTIAIKASEFIGEIGSDPAMVVQISRTTVVNRPVVFSGGIEVTQVVGPSSLYVRVEP